MYKICFILFNKTRELDKFVFKGNKNYHDWFQTFFQYKSHVFT